MSKMSSPIVTRRGAQNAKIQTRAMVKSKSGISNTTASASAATTTSAAAAATAATSSMNSGNNGSAASNNTHSDSRKPNAALLEAKRRARMQKAQNNTNNAMQEGVTDIFQNAIIAKGLKRKSTALIYDESMNQHCCLWDQRHPECPERFTRVIERCRELQLIERCEVVASRRATKAEILQLHTHEHYEKLQKTSGVHSFDEMEEMSSTYDSIYIHPSTFELSLLASGSTIQLIDHLLTGKAQNGMAIIRPPGHHAMKSEFNGYCFFNNVALAAQHAMDAHQLQRILIIDYDVHHGQGTQRFFYNDPRVLYFSIHRFEHGTFWPNLMESDYYAIGSGPGCGYNFNVPLNRTGMGNGDYLAIFQQLLLPVALEFQPELIIISAGYDAALGCPEGEMEVTPACYPHLINPLLRLAEGRVAVVLEGGYCLDSLAEGAALTLRALLGDPCPPLVERLQLPCEELCDALLNCIYAHRSYWRCLQLQRTYTLDEFNTKIDQIDQIDQIDDDDDQHALRMHRVQRHWIGGPSPSPPERYPTRDTAPKIPPEIVARNGERLRVLRIETKLSMPTDRVCYAYEPQMLQHCNLHDLTHPEQPKRIRCIYQMHDEYRLLARMSRVAQRSATTDELCLAHTRAHVNFIRRLQDRDPNELQQLGSKYNSVYFHPNTFECATLSAGAVLQVVDRVLRGDARSGVCIVRPPGHHAETDQPHGFCIFNNVAIAAQYALRDYGLERVLIVDWDVHHGNGTQHIFESNPKVLYISVHRYENGTFFPKGPDGNYNVVGKGAGRGFNVNIPWNKRGMGDLEYALAFQQLIMPIAYEFQPQLVLVSAGFDAAIGDPLGGCKVTPEGYGLFTHWLSALANGRIVICLEGGYNVHSISYAMTMCTKTLLGDPVPTPQFAAAGQPQRSPTVAFLSCIETLQMCVEMQQDYWKSLASFARKLPQYQVVVVNENNNKDFLAASMQQLTITSTCTDALGGGGRTGGGADGSDVDIASGCSTSSGSGSSSSSSKPKVKVKTLTDFLDEQCEAAENQEFFAIYPRKTCPHLDQLQPEKAPKFINTNGACIDCSAEKENWICLICFDIRCGRYINGHMETHNQAHGHPLALSFSDLSVWCYACSSYIEHPRLYIYQNVAHVNKFGEQMIWTHKCQQRIDNCYSIKPNGLDDNVDNDGQNNPNHDGIDNMDEGGDNASNNFYIQLERNN